MNPLLDAAIATSVILSAALATAAACRNRSAALRHLILSVAIALAIAVPLLHPLVPAWTLPFGQWWSGSPSADPFGTSVLSSASTPSEVAAPARVDPRRIAESLRPLLISVWLTGVAIGLLRLLAGLLRLAWLAARSEGVTQSAWTECASDVCVEYRVCRPVLLLQSDHPSLLVTWGALCPKIVLPRGADRWSPDRIRIVLGHELAHIRRYDWTTRMAAEFLRSVYWFNPLAWIACSRLRQESEQACDDLVLRSGIRGSQYATHLVDLALAAANQRTMSSPALAIARPSSLERRIRAMLTATISRKPIALPTGIIISVAGLCLAVPVAGFTTSSGRALHSVGSGHGVTVTTTVVRQSVLDRRLPGDLDRRRDPKLGVVAGTTLLQSTFASFSGTLTDPYGGLLPAVTLTLLNVQSKAKQEVHSDRSGRFEFVGLPAGDYELEARLPGFETLRRTVSFAAGMIAEANLAMQIGSIQETVTVSDSDAATLGFFGGSRSSGDRGARICSAPVDGGIGGNLKPPVAVAHAQPIYPPSAQSGKIEGVVILQGRIDTSGLVTDLRVLRSPNADLAGAALEAVSAWRFDATLLNCVPIDTAITVTINFSLSK